MLLDPKYGLVRRKIGAATFQKVRDEQINSGLYFNYTYKTICSFKFSFQVKIFIFHFKVEWRFMESVQVGRGNFTVQCVGFFPAYG